MITLFREVFGEASLEKIRTGIQGNAGFFFCFQLNNG